MLQENVDLYAKWIDKLGSAEVTEEGYEDTFEGHCQVNLFSGGPTDRHAC